MKADYVHKDTLTATDYIELNKNNELLMSYNQALLKENRALMKQLHEASLTIQEMIERDVLCPSNCDKLEKLLKENQELKKQLDKANDEIYTLKNKYNIRLLNQISENIEPDCEDYYLAEIETKGNKYDLIQTQQKEFIKYLEDEIEKATTNPYTKLSEYGMNRIHIYKEILQKYKEIIGDD